MCQIVLLNVTLSFRYWYSGIPLDTHYLFVFTKSFVSINFIHILNWPLTYPLVDLSNRQQQQYVYVFPNYKTKFSIHDIFHTYLSYFQHIFQQSTLYLYHFFFHKPKVLYQQQFDCLILKIFLYPTTAVAIAATTPSMVELCWDEVETVCEFGFWLWLWRLMINLISVSVSVSVQSVSRHNL